MRLGWARGLSSEVRTGWSSSAEAGTDLGSCHLGNCTFGKLPLGEIPLGSCHLGKYSWEVATWEKSFGKVPYI